MTKKSRRRSVILLLVGALLVLTVMAGIAAMMAKRNPIAFLNRITPGFFYALDANIAYGDLDRQTLDVYRPTTPRATPAPVVVFFYGGAWKSGERSDYRFVGQALARAGFTVVIPDYRLAPEVTFPAFLEDCAKALRWTQDHIAEHGGDSHRLFLMGHSAGAYNVMLLTLDRRYTAAAGVDGGRIRGVVGIAGPYNFSLDDPFLQTLFGTAHDPQDTQPVSFAHFGAPPVLLVTGDADETVDPGNSRALAQELKAANSPVTLLEVPGLKHRSSLLQLSPIWSPGGAVRDDILRFLDDPDAFKP
jgi:acetyl esterase/lipase